MLLFLSIAFLFIAPIINLVSESRDYFAATLNGFVFVAISALVFVGIIPELMAQSGITILFLMLIGLVIPTLSEKAIHNSHLVHKTIIFLAMLGLAFHTLIDGVALSKEHTSDHLSLAVALHRIPVGLLVWWYVKPHFGRLAAYLMLAVIACGTIVGFHYSDLVFTSMQATEVAYFQAVVCGMLVHVILHQHHDENKTSNSVSFNRNAEGIGNLLGVLSVIYLLHGEHDHGSESGWLDEASTTLTTLFMEIAPIILIVIVLSWIVKTIITKQTHDDAPSSLISRLKTGLHYSTHQLIDTIAPWILTSLLLITCLEVEFHWLDVAMLANQEHHWSYWAAITLVLILFCYSIFRNGMRSFIAKLSPHSHHEH